MDPEEKRHIVANYPVLLEYIVCNILLIAHLQGSQTLSSVDVDILDSIPSQLGKTKKLLEILQGRSNGYKQLLLALQQTNQSGAVGILQGLNNGRYKENQSPTAVDSQQSQLKMEPSHSKYRLKFDSDIGSVLTTLLPRLVSILGNKEINRQIILQLKALLLFEHDEVQPIVTYDYRSEQQRISELFDVIRATGEDGIIMCLEKLCDLEGLPKYSERIRGIILGKFPGSLRHVE